MFLPVGQKRALSEGKIKSRIKSKNGLQKFANYWLPK